MQVVEMLVISDRRLEQVVAVQVRVDLESEAKLRNVRGILADPEMVAVVSQSHLSQTKTMQLRVAVAVVHPILVA
jgi:hypothetical protein